MISSIWQQSKGRMSCGVPIRSSFRLDCGIYCTEDGTAYYVDPEGNSFWDLQAGMRNSQQQQEQDLERVSLPPGWVQAFDEEGEAYYIGPEDQCQWERP